jgi:hypothetical protein
MASECFELLRLVADALLAWAAHASRATWQQQQQSARSKRQSCELLNLACELHDSSRWLPAAATDVICVMRHGQLCSAVDERLLLDTLGHLLQRVI